MPDINKVVLITGASSGIGEAAAGVVETELGHDITDPATAEVLQQFRKAALQPDSIARAVRFAIEQPDDVDVNEIIVRPVTANI